MTSEALADSFLATFIVVVVVRSVSADAFVDVYSISMYSH